MAKRKVKHLSHKFRVTIDLDLREESFDVQVENLSTRKGFVDVEQLKTKLLEVMRFMRDEGVDSLVENVTREQMH